MTDRLIDPLDIAAEQEEEFRQEALRMQARLAADETHPDFDGKHCIDCDDEIVEGRLRLHKIRCIICQEIKERRR